MATLNELAAMLDAAWVFTTTSAQRVTRLSMRIGSHAMTEGLTKRLREHEVYSEKQAKRIAELEERCAILNSARVASHDAAESLRGDIRASEAECDEAREAVRRLARALESHKKAMDHHGGDIDFSLWEALADPVVRRVVAE